LCLDVLRSIFKKDAMAVYIMYVVLN